MRGFLEKCKDSMKNKKMGNIQKNRYLSTLRDLHEKNEYFLCNLHKFRKRNSILLINLFPCYGFYVIIISRCKLKLKEEM